MSSNTALTEKKHPVSPEAKDSFELASNSLLTPTRSPLKLVTAVMLDTLKAAARFAGNHSKQAFGFFCTCLILTSCAAAEAMGQPYDNQTQQDNGPSLDNASNDTADYQSLAAQLGDPSVESMTENEKICYFLNELEKSTFAKNKSPDIGIIVCWGREPTLAALYDLAPIMMDKTNDDLNNRTKRLHLGDNPNAQNLNFGGKIIFCDDTGYFAPFVLSEEQNLGAAMLAQLRQDDPEHITETILPYIDNERVDARLRVTNPSVFPHRYFASSDSSGRGTITNIAGMDTSQVLNAAKEMANSPLTIPVDAKELENEKIILVLLPPGDYESELSPGALEALNNAKADPRYVFIGCDADISTEEQYLQALGLFFSAELIGYEKPLIRMVNNSELKIKAPGEYKQTHSLLVTYNNTGRYESVTTSITPLSEESDIQEEEPIEDQSETPASPQGKTGLYAKFKTKISNLVPALI